MKTVRLTNTTRIAILEARLEKTNERLQESNEMIANALTFVSKVLFNHDAQLAKAVKRGRK